MFLNFENFLMSIIGTIGFITGSNWNIKQYVLYFTIIFFTLPIVEKVVNIILKGDKND